MPRKTRESYTITTDRSRLDIDLIHGFLTRCYWARGIPKQTVIRSIRNSLCFGVYHRGRQVGFARVISDRATFAYIADVFVLESHGGLGLGKRLTQSIRNHPELQGLRCWHLMTRDAHGLYRQFGFSAEKHPERHMEILNPEIYRARPPASPT